MLVHRALTLSNRSCSWNIWASFSSFSNPPETVSLCSGSSGTVVAAFREIGREPILLLFLVLNYFLNWDMSSIVLTKSHTEYTANVLYGNDIWLLLQLLLQSPEVQHNPWHNPNPRSEVNETTLDLAQPIPRWAARVDSPDAFWLAKVIIMIADWLIYRCRMDLFPQEPVQGSVQSTLVNMTKFWPYWREFIIRNSRSKLIS